MGACVIAVIFFGGWHLPGYQGSYLLVTSAKVVTALVAVVFARNALPALTPAVALRVCWIVLLPLAVAALVVVELVT